MTRRRYQNPQFIHPAAIVESTRIGPGTRIWAFTHVMRGTTIGRDCNIGEHCYLERGASIGDRVTIKNHVAVWDGIHIAEDVFIGPQATLINDRWPRSRNPDWIRLITRIQRGATIGANATLLGGVTVGQYALVGAGAVVTASVADYALVIGNPARRRDWVCRCACPLTFRRGRAECSACHLRYVQVKQGIQCLRAPQPGIRRLR